MESNTANQSTCSVSIKLLLDLMTRANPMSEREEVDGMDHELVRSLRDADPTELHHVVHVTKRGVICIYRKAEWHRSFAKTLADEERKAKLLEDELAYQHAKSVVMQFFLEVFPGDKAQAEKMFMPMCNNPKALIEKARKIEMAKLMEKGS